LEYWHLSGIQLEDAQLVFRHVGASTRKQHQKGYGSYNQVKLSQNFQLPNISIKLYGKIKQVKTVNDATNVFQFARDFHSRFQELLRFTYGFTDAMIESYTTNPLHIKIAAYKGVKYCYEIHKDPGKTVHQIMTIGLDDSRKTHTIWVRSSEDKSKNALIGHTACFPLLYFEWNPLSVITEDPDFRSCQVVDLIPVKLANGMTVKRCKPFQIVDTHKTKPYMTGNPGVGREMVLVERDSTFCRDIEHIEGAVYLVEWDE
jgi:hypothetical protein